MIQKEFKKSGRDREQECYYQCVQSCGNSVETQHQHRATLKLASIAMPSLRYFVKVGDWLTGSRNEIVWFNGAR